jgi:hypothetical protein
MNPNLPPRPLYKYRTIGCKYTEDIFRNRRLYFAAPASFNDPFDCNLPLKFEGDANAWHRFLNEYFAEGARFSEEDRGRIVDALMAQRPWDNPTPFQEILDGSRRKIRNESSVFCWAEKPDDVLMFAYYADGHKGICLELLVGFEHEIGMTAHVTYPPDFPLLNYIHVRHDLSNILIFRKAPFWAHECELRAFRYGVPPGHVSFPCHLLRRVIFGSEATCKSVELVKNMVCHLGIALGFCACQADGRQI